MRFLDFLKSPNQSQSLFCLVEGHHFGSGNDSASDLSAGHATFPPKAFLVLLPIAAAVPFSEETRSKSKSLRAGGGFARTSQQAPWQTLAVFSLSVRPGSLPGHSKL